MGHPLLPARTYLQSLPHLCQSQSHTLHHTHRTHTVKHRTTQDVTSSDHTQGRILTAQFSLDCLLAQVIGLPWLPGGYCCGSDSVVAVGLPGSTKCSPRGAWGSEGDDEGLG